MSLLLGVESSEAARSSRDFVDWIADLSPAVGIFIGVVAAVLAYHEFKNARREAQIARSLGFLERYQQVDFQRLGSVFLSYVDVEPEHEIGIAADCVEKIQAWESAAHADEECLPRSPRAEDGDAPRASKNQVRIALAFFEDLGAAYNQGLLDEETIHKVIATIPVDAFLKSWWYMCWRRDGKLLGEGSTLYEEFEELVHELRSNDALCERNKKLRDNPRTGIRLLILPKKDAGEDDWALCARVSESFSSYLAATDDALVSLSERLRRTVKSDGRSVVAKVVAVPPNLRQDPVAWSGERTAARDLLMGCSAADLDALEKELPRLSA